MAGQYFPQPDSIGSLVANMQRQLEALATTPSAGNQSIRDGALVVLGPSGNAETLIGQYTWPSAPWVGVKIYGMVTFNGTGHPIVVCGLQPDGLYGLGIYSDSGARTVLLGQQPTTGTYGLSIANIAGILQQVGGTLVATGANALGQTGTAASPQSLGVSVTANIGQSHQALVSWGGGLVFTGTAPQGNIELQLDGTRITTGGIFALTAYADDNVGSLSITKNFLLDCGSAGSHTFSLLSWETSGGTFDVTKPILIVNPL